MTAEMIFAPVLVQVLLTVYVYLLLAVRKSKAMRAGLVDETRRSLHDDAWPDNVIQVNNNIRNQFEVPILFFVLVIVLFALGAADWFAQVVAWIFVLSRIAHMLIHTGSNYVPMRRRIFMFGVMMIFVLAVDAAIALIRHGLSV